MFPWEFCKIFKSISFTEHLRTTTSVNWPLHCPNQSRNWKWFFSFEIFHCWSCKKSNFNQTASKTLYFVKIYFTVNRYLLWWTNMSFDMNTWISCIKYVWKMFCKTRIFHPMIGRRTFAYQEVRNVSLWGNFAYLLNEWSLAVLALCGL